MASRLLSIIIPIYNEEHVAAESLPRILELPINKEVVIVNDGSTDQTKVIIEELGKRYDFRLIDQPTNQGKGAAIKRGLEEIKGSHFIVCDADQEYEPDDIIRLFSASQKENENVAIYGSRFLNQKPFAFHYFVNRFLTSLTNLLFSSHLSDMETCFKLVPTPALGKIRLSGRRFEIEPEITAQLLKNGYQIKELPINYSRRSYQEGKKIRARDGWLAIKTLLREKLK